jgi:4-hydroxyproline epimerase
MDRLRVIDSHTGGEPTRVVVSGLPELGGGSIGYKLERLKQDFDPYRSAVIGEPRSSPVAVGAYLLPSDVADHGVIFFNIAGYLGMCGHGTIGLVATLRHLGLLQPGKVSLETPVGIVRAELHVDGRASFENVPAYRHLKGVRLRLGQVGEITGDVAYGGNWFFISSDHGQEVERGRIAQLDMYTALVQDVLNLQGITGRSGLPIDHIELVGPSERADARNYVRCPGGEYDRSPCGTGTSAKLACLFEDGKLREGQVFKVESIIGSVFEGSVRREGDCVIPKITGRAYVNGESAVLIDPEDPFAWGIQTPRDV